MEAAHEVSNILGIKASGLLPLMSAIEAGLPLTSLDRVVHAVAPADTKLSRGRRSHADARPRPRQRIVPKAG
jgi:hypothetical protein